MKKVLILFGKCNWNKSRPFDNKKYMYSYEYFYDLCRKGGIQMYRASYQWYDNKNKIFKYAWSFEGKSGKWKRVYNLEPDLIYDKTKSTAEAFLRSSLIRKRYPFFNSIEFSKIADNKLAVSMIFSEWSQKCQVVRDKDELLLHFKKTSEKKMLVLKPINLSGGENVLIGTKNDISKKIKDNGIEIKDWILQDFIDSSSGIPRIMKGCHDLRLVIIDNKIIYSYYRKPAAGGLLANLAQGGSMEIVPVENLPQSLFPIIRKASEIFSGFDHKIYALDVMFDKNAKPWIVELNSMPGMYFAEGQEKVRTHFYGKLLEIFKDIL